MALARADVTRKLRTVPAAPCSNGHTKDGKPSLFKLALRTSLSMQGQSRNTITTNIRYDRGNRIIGRDLIATYLGAYGKYRWRRVEAIGLTGSVTLGAGDIDIAANRWIDGHASCRHFRSVLQAKLCPHPVTELPNSENHQNEQRQGYRKFNRGSAPPVLEESFFLI